MKKQLMTTTALVAAGVIATSGAALGASKPKLSLGGWFEGIIGIADQEEKCCRQSCRPRRPAGL